MRSAFESSSLLLVQSAVFLKFTKCALAVLVAAMMNLAAMPAQAQQESTPTSEVIGKDSTDTEPADDQASDDQASNIEASEGDSADIERTESEPTESEPTESEPTESEPTESEPSESEPSESKPSESESQDSQATETERSLTPQSSDGIDLPSDATEVSAAQQASDRVRFERPAYFRPRLPPYYTEVVDGLQRERIYAIQKQYWQQVQNLKEQIAELESRRDRQIESQLRPEQRERVEQLRREAFEKRSAQLGR